MKAFKIIAGLVLGTMFAVAAAFVSSIATAWIFNYIAGMLGYGDIFVLVQNVTFWLAMVYPGIAFVIGGAVALLDA